VNGRKLAVSRSKCSGFCVAWPISLALQIILDKLWHPFAVRSDGGIISGWNAFSSFTTERQLWTVLRISKTSGVDWGSYKHLTRADNEIRTKFCKAESFFFEQPSTVNELFFHLKNHSSTHRSSSMHKPSKVSLSGEGGTITCRDHQGGQTASRC